MIEEEYEKLLGELLDEAQTHEKACTYGGAHHSVWFNIEYRLSSAINDASRHNRNVYAKGYIAAKQTLENAIKEVKALADNPMNGAMRRRMWARWVTRVEKAMAIQTEGTSTS